MTTFALYIVLAFSATGETMELFLGRGATPEHCQQARERAETNFPNFFPGLQFVSGRCLVEHWT